MTTKHFIDLADWSSAAVLELLDLAVALKAEQRNGGNQPRLKGKTLGMLFEKPSLRTRVSFEVGMRQLGGDVVSLSPEEVGLGKRESVADVIRVLSRYVDAVMARVFKHEYLLEMARWGSVPIINGLSDSQHPCQALADLLTIYEQCGDLKHVRIAYVGDGNNVALSLAQIIAHAGAHFAIATPPGYELSEDALVSVEQIAARTGASLAMYHEPAAALAGADIIYTDTWVSMGQEAQSAARIEALRPYQVNADLLRHAGTGARIMHCLPAHRGYEITDEVADSAQSLIFDQAENRLHAQKAILVTLLT